MRGKVVREVEWLRGGSVVRFRVDWGLSRIQIDETLNRDVLVGSSLRIL
jgi:hypothetical protein